MYKISPYFRVAKPSHYFKPIVVVCLALSPSLYLVVGQSIIRITQIDTASYPTVSLIVKARKPHLDFTKPNHIQQPSANFKVSEIYDNVETKIKNPSIEVLKKEAQSFNLVWIIDASLSLKPSVFAKVIRYSKAVIDNLKNQDRMAIYSAKEEPKLLIDFSTKQKALMKTLTSIAYDGQITRLYDAIYSGIYTAQSSLNLKTNAETSLSSTNKHTAVVLLTDGKEELSYFNDNDCYELSVIGKKLNIPIHVVLFTNSNASPAGQNQADDPHHRRLKRLSLKTSASFSKNPKPSESLLFLHKIRQLAESTYSIRYVSTAGQHATPGSQIIARVAWQEGDYNTVHSFRIPWLYFLYYPKAFFLIGLGFFLLIIAIFLIKLIAFRLHQTKKGKESKQQLESFHQDMALEENIARGTTQESHKKPEQEDNEKLQQNLPVADLEPLPDPFPISEPGVLMEDERSLYLREHSYCMLQLALRGARPYRYGGLRTIIPANSNSDSPKKRTYDLFLDSTLIGSGRWAHIPVRDPVASPTHARIKKIDQRFVIYDLMSGSGLYINSKKVLRPMALKHGDDISIGRTHFIFLGKN